ncbi:MAG TPA: hypothetical protein VM366_09240, partial [Anaerolineae bacterium]|nr:hypothetical protein [Anaerolineae bacterium]
LVLAVDSTTILTLMDPQAAGSGGDLADMTATFAAMNGSDASIGLDVNLTGANAAGTGNTLAGIDIDLTTADAQAQEIALDVSDADWDYAIDAGSVPLHAVAQQIFLDFWGDTLPDEIVLLNGSDEQALDPAIVANEQYGVMTLVSGDADTNCATDCSEANLGTVYKANQGGLVFEIRAHIDTTITNAAVCFGFTDVATLEAPASVAGTTITYQADDFVAFCFDDAADTDQWYAIGRTAGTTPATGNGLTGVAPVADTYQTFRIEVDADGAGARFYIAGVEVGTLTANAVTATDLLAPFISVDTNSTASVTVDVDYMWASAKR